MKGLAKPSPEALILAVGSHIWASKQQQMKSIDGNHTSVRVNPVMFYRRHLSLQRLLSWGL